MTFLAFVAEYGAVAIILIGVFSFIAGFIDAVVGGGGLIQIPALLINLPKTPLPTLFAIIFSLKIFF